MFSAIIALTALGTTTYLQYAASIDQRALKEYETTFRLKVDGYTRFLQAVSTSFDLATDRFPEPGRPRLRNALSNMELAEIQVEPFLKPSVRDRLRDNVQSFMAFCLETDPGGQGKSPSDDTIDHFLRYRTEFRTALYNALFR